VQNKPFPAERKQAYGGHGTLGCSGTVDHNAQRDRIAKLVALDVPGIVLRSHWTDEHTAAMRDALAAVTSGGWLLVYDPSQPVTVMTDASGNHGYCVTAHQNDPTTGEMRPIAYISRGWQGKQLSWTPQVKECYAQMRAVTKVMPAYFPFASVVLLCDNKTLTAVTTSEDARVVRWQTDIECSGCCVRSWLPGVRRTIADYGSRSVVAAPGAVLSKEDEFETYIYSLCLVEPTAGVSGGAGGPAAVASAIAGAERVSVPGHLGMVPMVAKIALAQEAAGAPERSTWVGAKFSVATLGGRSLVLYRNRLVVPRDAADIKAVLMRMAHDDAAHFACAARTLIQLQTQARVHWVGMQEDVQRYVDSCFRC
jgi:hypothetical protein